MSDLNMDQPVRLLVIPTNIHTSTITNINLYADRAQITRSYKFKLGGGTTNLFIEGLPNVMDHDSIRVEGRGNALIQGVSAYKISLMTMPEPSSDLLQDLIHRKTVASSALERYKKAISTIGKYVDTITIEHLDISKLGEAMDMYDLTEEKWEEKMRVMQAELRRLEEEIDKEQQRLEHGESKARRKLRTRVVIGLFRADEEEGDIEIVLIYGVSGALWEAGYDIRVDMENPNAPVKVVYKATINQRTAEAWTNVPITLETAQPTFGLEMPSFEPWTIAIHKPSEDRSSGRGKGGRGLGRGGAKRHRKILRREDDQEYDMDVEVTNVTSTGNVNATFRVPGLVTIPSDEEEHGVIIASLELEAQVTWGCVPKESIKVFLEAKITNSSEYTFLTGMGNVYVDRSFISRTEIPGVSPKEVFKVALGVDPSIRVTYHPQEKIVAQSGFYNKTIHHTFTQRISVHNSKSISIEGLRITDQIPVSQDATGLNVILVSPALTLPSPVGGTDTAANTKAKVPTVELDDDGVVAKWNGTDEVGQGKDLGALGKDGKIDWVCALPAFGKVNLLLKYEVIAGVKEEILGL